MIELDERSRALAYRLLGSPAIMSSLIEEAGRSESALDELRSAAALLFIFARSLEAALTEDSTRAPSSAVPDDFDDDARWSLPPHAPASVA